MQQCQAVKIEHSMYICKYRSILQKVIFFLAEMPNKLSVMQNNVAILLDHTPLYCITSYDFWGVTKLMMSTHEL